MGPYFFRVITSPSDTPTTKWLSSALQAAAVRVADQLVVGHIQSSRIRSVVADGNVWCGIILLLVLPTNGAELVVEEASTS
jgi:hypothetical protein